MASIAGMRSRSDLAIHEKSHQIMNEEVANHELPADNFSMDAPPLYKSGRKRKSSSNDIDKIIVSPTASDQVGKTISSKPLHNKRARKDEPMPSQALKAKTARGMIAPSNAIDDRI